MISNYIYAFTAAATLYLWFYVQFVEIFKLYVLQGIVYIGIIYGRILLIA